MDYIVEVDNSMPASEMAMAIKNSTADGYLGSLHVDPTSAYLVYGKLYCML